MHHDAVYFCAECGAKKLCLGADLELSQLIRLEGIPANRVYMRAGQALYRQGDAFSALFAVVSGISKSVVRLPNDELVVTGIAMRGDILGFPGMAQGMLPETLISEEDSIFCTIPYQHLMRRIQADLLVGRQFHKAVERTVLQRQSALLVTSGIKAHDKVRGFLCWYMHQLALREQESAEFKLPINYSDLASFLRLRLETVSRIFSDFSNQGIVRTRGRYIHVLDRAALQR